MIVFVSRAGYVVRYNIMRYFSHVLLYFVWLKNSCKVNPVTEIIKSLSGFETPNKDTLNPADNYNLTISNKE